MRGPQNGLPSPHLVLALVTQLINAGVRGEDIVFFEVAMGRTIGDPIVGKIKGNAGAAFQAVTFVVNADYGKSGRISPDARHGQPRPLRHLGSLALLPAGAGHGGEV